MVTVFGVVPLREFGTPRPPNLLLSKEEAEEVRETLGPRLDYERSTG